MSDSTSTTSKLDLADKRSASIAKALGLVAILGEASKSPDALTDKDMSSALWAIEDILREAADADQVLETE